MKGTSFKRGVDTKLLTFVLFGLCIYLKAFFAGLRYFPVLDDFIQYGCYPAYENPVRDVIWRVGLLAKRPLAGLFDLFVWGRMWGNMAWAVFIILTLYILTIYFIYKSFEFDKMRGGVWFLLFAGLTPLMDEGIYWISASSRIVVGLFFGSLACYLFYQYIENYCEKKLLPYLFASTILSFGFYEQVIPGVFVMLMMLIYKYKSDIKDRIVYFIPLISLAVIGGYYIIMQIAHVGDERIAAGFSLSFGSIASGLSQSLEVLFSVSYQYITNTFFRGLGAITANGGSFYLIITIIITLGFGVVTVLDYDPKYILNSKNSNTGKFLIVGGVLIYLTALIPNMITADAWVCLRNMVIPILGLGFIWICINEYIYINKYIMGAIVGIMAFVFTVSGIGDIAIYKQVSEYDVLVCNSIAQQIKDDEAVKGGEKEVVLLNPSVFYEGLKPFYKDHVKSVTYTDWALTGCVRDVADNLKIKRIAPISDGMTVTDLNNKLILILHDNKVDRLTLKGTNIIDQNGDAIGKWINDTVILN